MAQSGGGQSTARIARINEIADRYVRNIAQTKTFANDIYSGRGVNTARGRVFSQNTYMGINAG